MNDFTASNGLSMSHLDGDGLRVAIPPDGYEGWQKLNLHASTIAALREFTQAEADERLGRWRWPENPDYIVYVPAGMSHYVRVFDEREAIPDVIFREDVQRGHGSLAAQAALAYFDAHPVPKPWETADEGDIWVLTGAGGLEQPWFRRDGKWFSCTPSLRTYDAEAAIAGRRIWPEVSDGD